MKCACPYCSHPEAKVLASHHGQRRLVCSSCGRRYSMMKCGTTVDRVRVARKPDAAKREAERTKARLWIERELMKVERRRMTLTRLLDRLELEQ